MSLVWLLVVALIVWAGVFVFTLVLDGRVKAVERQVESLRHQENRR